MFTIKLKKGKGKKLREGHLWIYRNELGEKIPKLLEGCTVIVEDHKGKFICIGDYSPHSNIAIRVLSWRKEEINRDFFRKRILNAYNYRKKIYPEEGSFRLLFSEGDLLPGLIVDKYGDYLVVQPLTAAMDGRKSELIELLVELLNPRGIVERADSPIRKNEGLRLYKEVLYGEVPDRIIIDDGGLKFYVDMLNGEKTGYFFDQRENRRRLKLYAKDAEVLDVFSYTGGFSIHAGRYGAKRITAVDVSKKAINLAMENAKINEVDEKIDFVLDDAFEFMRKNVLMKRSYDLIILDPPAFAKSKEAKNDAYRGYKEINLRALQMLKPGGLLLSCSCSYHFHVNDLLSAIRDAAIDAGRDIRIAEIRGQSPDHPVNLAVPETNYLKAVYAMAAS